MSRMHNPAHPGEVLREWLPDDMTVTQAAKELLISRVTLSKVLNGKAGVTAGMALRLSAWLGTSADLWLGMQPNGISGRPSNCRSRTSRHWNDLRPDQGCLAALDGGNTGHFSRLTVLAVIPGQ
jgi:addiction module HigA family antidote